MRQLESMIRLSEALARLHCSDIVSDIVVGISDIVVGVNDIVGITILSNPQFMYIITSGLYIITIRSTSVIEWSLWETTV